VKPYAKRHVKVYADTEVICAAEVSPATSGDAAVAPTLLDDLTPAQDGGPATRAVVYGDSAYGTGTNLVWLAQQRLTPMVKTQVPTAPGGRFAKDQFRIDLQAQTMTCPARVTVAIRPARRGGGRARFGRACSVCPLRAACTSSALACGGLVSRSRLDETGRAIRRLAVKLTLHALACELQPYTSCRVR
jgi:hypothetical protein